MCVSMCTRIVLLTLCIAQVQTCYSSYSQHVAPLLDPRKSHQLGILRAIAGAAMPMHCGVLLRPLHALLQHNGFG